jgi:hypothetical protein
VNGPTMVEGNPNCLNCGGSFCYRVSASFFDAESFFDADFYACQDCIRYVMAKAWEDGRGQGAAGATHMSRNPYRE